VVKRQRADRCASHFLKVGGKGHGAWLAADQPLEHGHMAMKPVAPGYRRDSFGTSGPAKQMSAPATASVGDRRRAWDDLGGSCRDKPPLSTCYKAIDQNNDG